MNETTFDEDALDEAYQRALSEEKAGRFETAAAAYRTCLSIDPHDHVGAHLRLAAIGAGETPASAGEAYVATLFDQQAEMFEDILVRQLGYGVPDLMARRLESLGISDCGRVLDLGCGTGLVGLALQGRAREMFGVDLSENMIELCFDTEAYDHLFVGEVQGFLEDFEDDEPFDLITAADVLPYIGDLTSLLAAVTGRLGPGGLFAASTETFSQAVSAPAGFVVGRDHRFHHGEDYVRNALAQAGLDVLSFEAITVRMQDGKPAPGHLLIARKIA
ncbi:class I SAM-dependent DNA methyltransferase [Jiella marina]|uniref:class I SAM-dependent DNA methyltransferase n=1 Tax=Jiella sp. LLJ827 TaxID=2917712 RepID=UPI002100F14E|nr:methyltransferase domain-containing protein [Jiella sp. LLJ827]MCQ0989123.1 methyltransferase domain-containing protein [Jiella sp. LLJ827]